MNFWMSIGYVIAGLVIGGFLGFYFTRKKFEKQLRDNPPVNEKMIRQSISMRTLIYTQETKD